MKTKNKIAQLVMVLLMMIFVVCPVYGVACADPTSTATATATATGNGGAGGAGGNGYGGTVNSTINPIFVNMPSSNSSATIAKGAVTNNNSQSQTANGGSVANSGNSVNNIGNGLNNFSPSASATIAKGAVQNTNNVDVKNQNTAINTNLNSNTIAKGAVQNTNTNQQKQSQSVNNGQTVAPVQVVNTPSMLQAPEINPFYLMPLQGGKVGDATNTMPQFDNPALRPLQKNDRVVKVLDVYFGNIFSRITYEEVEEYLLKKAEKYDGKKGKIRYSVKYQDSVITTGMGGGASLSGSGNEGTMSSTGSILPGASKSTANPIFFITFYEVK